MSKTGDKTWHSMPKERNRGEKRATPASNIPAIQCKGQWDQTTQMLACDAPNYDFNLATHGFMPFKIYACLSIHMPWKARVIQITHIHSLQSLKDAKSKGEMIFIVLLLLRWGMVPSLNLGMIVGVRNFLWKIVSQNFTVFLVTRMLRWKTFYIFQSIVTFEKSVSWLVQD